MKKSKNNGKARTVYIFFLIRILPILIVPLFVMIAIYYWSIKVINQKTYEKNLVVLQNSAKTIKKTFDNMDNLIAYINESPNINKIFTTVNPVENGSTTSDFLKVQGEIKALSISNELIKSIQIYSKKNNILIDSSTNALFIKRYYTSSFFIKNMSFDEWYNNILLAHHNYDIYPNLEVVTTGSQTRKSILYAKSVPLLGIGEVSGGIFILLDESDLKELFSGISYQNSGFIYILDKSRESVIYDNGSDLDNPMADINNFTDQSGYLHQDINGKDMFVTYFKDEHRDWIYVAALPRSQVLKPTSRIRFYIGILILSSFLAGGILLFMSVEKISKPIKNVYTILFENNNIPTYNEFEYEVSKLVENNKHMQEALQRQIPELKTSIFYNLLMGRFYTKEYIYENLSKININLDSNFYVIIIASINDFDTKSVLEEISARKVYINSILEEKFENVQGIYNLDFERTVLLLSYEKPEYVDVMEYVEENAMQIVEDLYTKFKVSISFSGDITNNIVKIPSAFLNANTAINYRKKNMAYTVQWFNKARLIDNLSFYYPIELESQIIALVNAGNMTSLPEIFEKIEHRNKYILTPDNSSTIFRLLQSMDTTLSRILNGFSDLSEQVLKLREKITIQLDKRNDLLQTYYLMKELFITIAENKKDEIRKNGSCLIYQIQKYINDKYSDSQLSLSSISDVFGITEVYISYLFKQETGKNFSKYVEKLRMERALELIKEGNILINDITEMVGYNSPQVFRRAYKRYYGVTPSDSKHLKKPNN